MHAESNRDRKWMTSPFFYLKTSVVVAFEQEKQQHDQMHTAFKYFQVQVVGNRMWCGLATTIG